MTLRHVGRGRSALLGTLTAVLASALIVSVPSAAQAAAGDPFDPAAQRIFASKSDNQGDPTSLFELTPGVGGYSFTPIGPAADLVYNALAFNTDDNYLYAISGQQLQTDVEPGSLLRIGNAGGYDVVGSGVFKQTDFQTNMGAYVQETQEFWVLSAQGSTIYRVDMEPGPDFGTLIDTVTIDPTNHDAEGGGSDWTYADGAFWTLGRTALARVTPDGGTDFFPIPAGADSPIDSDQAGAAWTFGGGDLGFSYNGSGQVMRIAVTNPDSDTPTFTVVSNQPGAGSGQNDGAAVPGQGIDLAIEKTGEIIDDGDAVRYTLTVTNLGAGTATGWSVEDTLPDGLSNASVSGDGDPQVSGSTVTAGGPVLEEGASVEIVIEADWDSASEPELENVATVTGPDLDPNLANNEDVAVLELPDDPADPAAPDTGVERESMLSTYAALSAGLLMLLALLVWRGVAARRE